MKNMTFKTAKKLGIVVSASMLPHKMTMMELINSCASLQNCDRVVICESAYSSLYQKIGRLLRNKGR